MVLLIKFTPIGRDIFLYFFAFLLLGPLSSGLYGQDVIQHIFKSDNRNLELEKILYLSAGVECIKYGLSSTDSNITEGYLLITKYELKEEGLDLSYFLYSADAPSLILAEQHIVLQIDYAMNAAVLRTIGKLFRAANISEGEDGNAQIQRLFIEKEKEKSPSKSKLWSASASGSVLFVFGQITKYFHYGGGAKINLLRNWDGKFYSFSAGIQGSYYGFFKDDGVNGGDLSLATSGAELQFAYFPENSYVWEFWVAGGASYIMVSSEDSFLVKTVPYGELGLRCLFPIGDWIHLGGAVGFLGIFDKDLVITAISTSLVFKMEF